MVLPILSVSNIATSVDFYTNKLGWNKVFGMPGEDGNENFVMVSLREGVMYGLSAMHAPDPKGQGIALMTYVADETDIDAYYAECQSNGATIATEIKDEYWGDRCFGVADPDGYYIMFCKTVKQMSPEDILAATTA